MRDFSLRITEIFFSLQGESRTSGLPTIFVRLTGCPLRCQYCDSEYAFHGGEKMSFEQLFETIATYPTKRICVTGGEPLAQPNVIAFMAQFTEAGFEVSVETSGAMDISDVPPEVSIVMDLKTPDSGELARNRMDNIGLLKPQDQIKFVICSEKDFRWAQLKSQELSLFERVKDIFISPSFEQVDPVKLAQWVLDSGLDFRFQLQLHKQQYPKP